MNQQYIHYVYKMTCPWSGYYYNGMHSTKNLNDKYEGSGNWIGLHEKKFMGCTKNSHNDVAMQALKMRKLSEDQDKQIYEARTSGLSISKVQVLL